jgi:type II secretory pathway component PulC
MSVASRLRHFQFPRAKGLLANRDGRLRAARRGVEAILGVAIVGQLAATAVSISRLRELPMVPAVRWTGATDGAGSPRAAARIADAHLFGVLARPVVATSEAPAPPQWVLNGTLAATSPGRGRAILSQSDAPARLFAVGDDVAPDYRLSQVYPDHVVLEHGTELITLRMKKAANAGSFQLAAESVAGQGAPDEGNPSPFDRPENFVLADALLKPAPWLDSSGHYSGMRLAGRINNSNLRRYGFMNEDVITAVNGKPITSAISAQKALRDMSKGTATVTVVRNGAPEQVSVTLVDDGTF